MEENTTPTPPQNDSFNKEEFNSFVKDALEKIVEIKEAYTRLFTASEGKESIVKEIETKLQDIRQKYDYLFSTDEAGKIRIAELNSQVDEIKKYHEELLSGTSTIKADIKESQEKITEFYVYLFGGSDGEEAHELKVKKFITDILEFHTNLTKEDGYKKTVEELTQAIIEAHDDLFSEDEEGLSKVTILNKNIENIETFQEVLEKDIKPFIKGTKDDIAAKLKDASALLSKATGGSLVQGFLKSKNEYERRPNYKSFTNNLGEDVFLVFVNLFMFLWSVILLLLDYVLFIFPLLLSVFIFIQPDMVASMINKTSGTEHALSMLLSGLNFYARLIISLPLWWISWFGQRSISHKRRLAEEYNHKAQVATMYLKFASTDTENSYPLDIETKKELNKVLINAIARHPGEVYGKDETILDKIIKIIEEKRALAMATITDNKNPEAEKPQG